MVRRQEHVRTAIVGLGNVLLGDDGVGVHAIQALREDAPQGIILAEVGTTVLDALELLERVDFVVAIDAVEAGGPPGSIYSFDVGDAHVPKHISLHDFGIAAALQFLAPAARPQVTILGVEPATIDYGMQLSPAVQAVLGQVTRTARTLAGQWTSRTTGVQT